MYCVKATRALRSRSEPQTTGAVECWGNVSLIEQTQARGCGFLGQVSLCKKHFDEKVNQNKTNCCFPLRNSSQDCYGNFVLCPRRLFPVFDTFQRVSFTGTFICEKHLSMADQDHVYATTRNTFLPKW